MKKLINIAQKHINNGSPCQESSCPIALALNGQNRTKDCFYEIGEKYLTKFNNYGGKCERLPLTKKAQKFIHDFDNGKKVKPTKLLLDI